MKQRRSGRDAPDSGRAGSRVRARGRAGIAALAVVTVLAIAALAVWRLWPQQHDAGATSITERAREHAGMADAGALSSRVIPDEDLPPAGTRSLFDHLIAQNEALPYPFEKLVALIQAQDPAGAPPVALMIPLGRSLLKGQASFARPRVLVAADFEAGNPPGVIGLAPRGQLFLGFVENAAEIEVISYNEAAGRFEFQLVQDYCEGCVPRIVHARRAVCATCHQGAAPIFPQRPWNETNGQPAIRQGIVEARGDAPYLGVPALNPLGVPERFDELTEVANFIPVTQRIWLDGCGDGAHGANCRRLLLKLALRYAGNPGDFGADATEAEALRTLQAQHWPAPGIRVPEPDLRNRDPLAEQQTLLAALAALFTSEADPDTAARSNEDLAAFERLPRLPADLDPLTPRPPRRVLAATDLDGVYGLAALFTGADLHLLEERAGFAWARVEAGVDALPDAFFAPAPFGRVRTLQALLGGAISAIGDARKSAASTPSPAYCCLDTAQMSAPVAAGGPPLRVADGSALKAFEQYCFACHRGNPSKRLDFMSGASEAEVLARIRETPEIREVLDWPRYRDGDKAGKLMPPADSLQRAKMESALAQDPELLEKMRTQVPGLFDF